MVACTMCGRYQAAENFSKTQLLETSEDRKICKECAKQRNDANAQQIVTCCHCDGVVSNDDLKALNIRKDNAVSGHTRAMCGQCKAQGKTTTAQWKSALRTHNNLQTTTAKSRLIACTICNKKKTAEQFSKTQLTHKTRNRKVCKECATQRNDANAEQNVTCCHCDSPVSNDDLKAQNIRKDHAVSGHTRAMCGQCKANKKTPTDGRIYCCTNEACPDIQKQKGRGFFDVSDIRNWLRRGETSKLWCINCKTGQSKAKSQKRGPPKHTNPVQLRKQRKL
eukprot:7012005-Karenia_brevis.AAC.1